MKQEFTHESGIFSLLKEMEFEKSFPEKTKTTFLGSTFSGWMYVFPLFLKMNVRWTFLSDDDQIPFQVFDRLGE